MNDALKLSKSFTPYEQRAISVAMRAMERVLRQPGAMLTCPELVGDFLRIKLAGLQREVFAVLYVDSQNQLIAYEELFRGTLNQTAVYPREVVRAALYRNAAALIFAHNHPSGVAEPSLADRHLTNALKSSLGVLDIGVLDHVIIAGDRHYSFAEHGVL